MEALEAEVEALGIPEVVEAVRSYRSNPGALLLTFSSLYSLPGFENEGDLLGNSAQVFDPTGWGYLGIQRNGYLFLVLSKSYM